MTPRRTVSRKKDDLYHTTARVGKSWPNRKESVHRKRTDGECAARGSEKAEREGEREWEKRKGKYITILFQLLTLQAMILKKFGVKMEINVTTISLITAMNIHFVLHPIRVMTMHGIFGWKEISFIITPRAREKKDKRKGGWTRDRQKQKR